MTIQPITFESGNDDDLEELFDDWRTDSLTFAIDDSGQWYLKASTRHPGFQAGTYGEVDANSDLHQQLNDLLASERARGAA